MSDAARRLRSAIVDGASFAVIGPLQDAAGVPPSHNDPDAKRLKPMRGVTRPLADGEFGRWVGYMRGDELSATALLGAT